MERVDGVRCWVQILDIFRYNFDNEICNLNSCYGPDLHVPF